MKQLKTPYLFVYGTLQRSFPNKAARNLRQMSVYVGPSSVSGSLYSLGWYPAIQLHPRGKQVKGEIVRLKNIAKTLTYLDRYEGAYAFGDDYLRETVKVKTEQGLVRMAQIYVSNGNCSHLPKIASGVFRKKRG